MDKGSQPILEVINLKVSFPGPRGPAKVLDGVSFELYPGEILALVGETGCGKSVTATSILNLIPQISHLYQGEVRFEGENLLSLSQRDMSRIRGRRFNMIFQNPQSSINPVFTIGEQICRLIKMYLRPEIRNTRLQLGISRKRAIRHIACEKLEAVGLTDANDLLKRYAHQISGGMAQRIKIAMALIGKPDILIADEATSALDVTVQSHILSLLKRLCQENNTAILFITHDLGIAAQICDRISVMYSGRVVETAGTREMFGNPQHPYTKGLLGAVPKLGQKEALTLIPGIIPDLTNPPCGCRFHPRCDAVMDICRQIRPDQVRPAPGHKVVCHLISGGSDA